MSDDQREYEDIAERLVFIYKFLRRSRSGELNKTQWAKELGVGQSTLSNWLNGVRRPKPDEAIRLFQLYGVSLDFTYMGRSETLPYNMASAWLERPNPQ